ncbi:MAG: hypothetical protein AB9873_09700 [Syntrophobacteraceae bacterium]
MVRAVRIGLVFLSLLALPLWVYAQQSGHHGQAAPAGKKPAKAAAETASDKGGEHHKMQMMEQCKETMGKHDKMVAGMKAMDARLEEKLAAVKGAKTTDEKVSALEAALAEMATQRKEIHALMGDMHHARMKCGMMGGGMGGMMGGKPGGKEGMSHGRKGRMGGMGCCPMMKGQEGHGEHSSEAPKEDAATKKQ